jgi:23S rRNA (adenine2503-C2)-methyltransferase
MVQVINSIQACDGSKKYVFELDDHQSIEALFFRCTTYESICISSQVGCSLACNFCRTGIDGLFRNLNEFEIMEQINLIIEDIEVLERPLEIVFKGMGEPLLNYGVVCESISTMMIQIPNVSISLSTAGIVPRIYDLGMLEFNPELQVSLHGSNNQQRNYLMPITEKYNLDQVILAAKWYGAKTSKPVVFNYLLFNDFNDSLNDVERLADLLNDMNCYLKISRYNQIEEFSMQPSTKGNEEIFISKCIEYGLKVIPFNSLGVDIEGGCGQLRTRLVVTTNQGKFLTSSQNKGF